MVLRSLKDRLRERWNVSVAETGHHDKWQRADLAVCMVGSERVRIDSCLQSALELIRTDPVAQLTESLLEFI